MPDSRYIINEVRRNIQGVNTTGQNASHLTINDLQNLIDSSPTLKTLVEKGHTGIITPADITKIIGEIELSRNTKVDLNTFAQTMDNLQKNPYFVTPAEVMLAQQHPNYEDIPLSNDTLLSTVNGHVFIDPETGSYILAPTPNVQIVAPPKSEEGYIGPLTPNDIDNLQLILEDEIKYEREQQGEIHDLDAVSDTGKMGLYGITVDDLVTVGVVSQGGVDNWDSIPENEREDYAWIAVGLKLLLSETYETLPITVRTSLHWYILTHREYWLEKLIGPDAFLLYKKIQKLVSYRVLLENWKTTFRYFSLNFIDSRAQIAAHLLLQRLFGKHSSQLFGLGGIITTAVGRKATDVFNRAFKAVETELKATSAAHLDQQAKTIPTPPVPKPKSNRKNRDFPNVEQQDTNESLIRVSKNQGFYDPKGVYPRVKKIGEPDTNRLARGQKIKDTIVGHKDENRITNIPVARGATPGKWSQPKSPYNAKYPYNQVQESESGHVVELDDTPDNERLHWYHREGTFMEIDRNGTWTRRIVGDGYEVYERDGNIYIGGRANITIEGNCNVYVKNNVNLQVDGDLIADVHRNMKLNIAKNLDISVGADINMKAKGNIKYLSGKDFDVKSTKTLKMSGNKVDVRSNTALKFSGQTTVSMVSVLGTVSVLAGAGAVIVNGKPQVPIPDQNTVAALALASAATPATPADTGAPPKEKNPQEPKLPPLILESRVDKFAEALSTLSEDPEGNKHEIAVLKKKAIDEGLITKEELDRPLTSGAEDATAVPPLKPAKIASCSVIYGESAWSPTYRLSQNVTLGMLKGTDQLSDQHGLTKQDIVCNLRQLAENIIEPVFALVGKNQVYITSVFRYPGYVTGAHHPAVGVSFHEQGLAIDMCFNKTFSTYYDVAVQIKQSIEFDQLLLEYRIGTVKGVSTYKPWIHLGWNQSAINLANGRKGGPARKLAFVMKNDSRVSAPGTLVNLLPDSTAKY